MATDAPTDAPIDAAKILEQALELRREAIRYRDEADALLRGEHVTCEAREDLVMSAAESGHMDCPFCEPVGLHLVMRFVDGRPQVRIEPAGDPPRDGVLLAQAGGVTREETIERLALDLAMLCTAPATIVGDWHARGYVNAADAAALLPHLKDEDEDEVRVSHEDA